MCNAMGAWVSVLGRPLALERVIGSPTVTGLSCTLFQELIELSECVGLAVG